ncbi:hypothetical protein BpHYR1_051552 [Brachionus plicatilis]|uniref:Uncharacterized protein n=1 Tax=Brachionus plicatilis TaxID=10195 RepID=A0A3M7Q0T9_BRAPC|nr:hypothetical protein BpHYR1_051552 [Brachionus plicatilis]
MKYIMHSSSLAKQLVKRIDRYPFSQDSSLKKTLIESSLISKRGFEDKFRSIRSRIRSGNGNAGP